MSTATKIITNGKSLQQDNEVPGFPERKESLFRGGAQIEILATKLLLLGLSAMGLLPLDDYLPLLCARLLVLLCPGKEVHGPLCRIDIKAPTGGYLSFAPGTAESVGEHAGVAVGAYLDQQGLQAGRGRGSVCEPECEWERRCEDERVKAWRRENASAHEHRCIMITDQ
ncbi:hypothetical protein K438DRAFT_1939769 [Mycena galopus ATCC 62051]|nr:hypothetical protein K438DRAFT_1939769 [Mycena galopus ATCC 62051]